MKDDVDLILNSFCKPDSFTASRKVGLGTMPSFQQLGRVLSFMPADASYRLLWSGRNLCSLTLQSFCFVYMMLLSWPYRPVLTVEKWKQQHIMIPFDDM